MSKRKGSIDFVMIDDSRNEILELGGADFTTKSRLDEQWQLIPEFEGHTVFVADLKDEHGSIIEDKNVSSEDVSLRLGAPIGFLISKARQMSYGHCH